jgi:hypothetical protein
MVAALLDFPEKSVMAWTDTTVPSMRVTFSP